MPFPYKKILITGANGQLGNSFKKWFSAESEETFKHHSDVIYADRSMLDFSNSESISNFFERHSGIDLCINCAAYTQVDHAEDDEEKAYQVNQHAVAELARQSKRIGALLVHFSSDYVYHNHGNRPLLESDPTNAQSVYAKSKLAGEYEILDICSHFLIFRTSWLYGVHGHNFVKTMHRLGSAGKSLTVVADQVGAPTFTSDLAYDILQMLSKKSPLPKDISGIYNYSNTGQTNWYEYAKEIFQLTGLSVTLTPTTTNEYGAPAPRPLYSVLSHDKLNNALEIFPRSWQSALQDGIEQMKL